MTPGSHMSSVECVAVSADGRLALTGSADSSLHRWDAATARMLGKVQARRP